MNPGPVILKLVQQASTLEKQTQHNTAFLLLIWCPTYTAAVLRYIYQRPCIARSIGTFQPLSLGTCNTHVQLVAEVCSLLDIPTQLIKQYAGGQHGNTYRWRCIFISEPNVNVNDTKKYKKKNRNSTKRSSSKSVGSECNLEHNLATWCYVYVVLTTLAHSRCHRRQSKTRDRKNKTEIETKN